MSVEESSASSLSFTKIAEQMDERYYIKIYFEPLLMLWKLVSSWTELERNMFYHVFHSSFKMFRYDAQPQSSQNVFIPSISVYLQLIERDHLGTVPLEHLCT
jgi:hypothetical protein